MRVVVSAPAGIAERELVERAKGDPEAFAELYLRYRERVQRYAFVQLRNHHDAEDLTSEVFTRALAAIGRYEHTGAAFHCWLFRIASNVIADQSRRARHRRHEDVDKHRDDLVAMGSLEDLVVGRDRLRRMVRAARLLPSQRQVLALRFGQDLDVASVARRMGRTEGGVRLLQHRALRSLRAVAIASTGALELVS